MSDRFDYLELDDAKRRRSGGTRRLGGGVGQDVPQANPVNPVSRLPPPVWRVVELIGDPGSGAGQFACPGGLAVDPDGNLFVADSYNHRIQCITPSGDVYVLGRHGTGPGEFLSPQAVVTDGAAGFSVLEQGGCRIQRFGPNAEWRGAFGSRGRGRGEMLAPMGMARGPCGALFVADTGNGRIVKWSPDDVFLDTYPPAGSPPLARPQGITLDAAGRIWIAETLRHRILVLDALFRPLAAFGGPGNDLGQFQEPQDLAITPDGCLLVADTGNDRVQVLDPSGTPLQAIESFHAPGRQTAPLGAPAGLAVRSEGEAYVADTGNHRVLRLQRR